MMLLLKRCLGRGAESLSNLGTRGPRCHTTQPKSANGRGVPPPNAGCADTLLLGAAWVLCAPPSRALGTVATAGKALNYGTDDHQPVSLSSRALAQSLWNAMAQGPVVHSALRVVPGALLLGAAWVLCAPPSRALGTVATAGKALNHGTTHTRDTVVY